MDDAKLKLNSPRLLAIPQQAADRLLEAGDGDCALLYLYLVKNGGVLDTARAAREMRLTPRAIQITAMRLTRLGLLSDGVQEPLPSRELPEYPAADVVRRSQSDPAFQALVEEAQQILGRLLTSTEVKKLFGIYDDLSLPADVIMLLIHHCKDEYEARYGAERHLGFAVIEKEAFRWFDQELMTYEQAERALAELARRKSLVGEIQRALGIRGRELTPTERRYIDNWVELGFGPEELAVAADRTITNTGGLKWKYMDTIVRSWHGKGLHSVQDIEQKDRKPARDAGSATSAPDAGELERMKRLRERMKNG